MRDIENDRFDYQKQNLPFILHKNIPSIHKGFYTNWHTEPEFLLIVSGSETIYIENEIYVAEPGDIVAVDSGRMHTGSGPEWKHHCLIPSVEFLETLEINPTELTLSPFIRDEKLAELFLDIVRASDEEAAFWRPKIIVAAERFLLSIYTQYARRSEKNAVSAKGKVHFVITMRVINYLRTNYATDFPIEDIAREIGITTSHMCRCVKLATGKTIVDHLNFIRCQAAYYYLMHSDKNIYEIAALCGFNNSSYFSKTYQQVMGVSPSETRGKKGT